MIEVRRVVNLTKGQGFTQVRPLLIEVKTYFLLRLYCCGLDLDYKVPTPLIQESATTSSGVTSALVRPLENLSI